MRGRTLRAILVSNASGRLIEASLPRFPTIFIALAREHKKAAGGSPGGSFSISDVQALWSSASLASVRHSDGSGPQFAVEPAWLPGRSTAVAVIVTGVSAGCASVVT